MDIVSMGKQAKEASYVLMKTQTEQKNNALQAAGDALMQAADEIMQANAVDIENGKAKSMAQAMQDRLLLNKARIQEMADGLRELAALPDPVGGADEMFRRPNGLLIAKRRVPLGVVGIIFESRPNVTADAAGICLKSSNVCILRGGSEAIHSNIAIVNVLRKAVASVGLPEDCILLVDDTSHETAERMMGLREYIDVLIPRGGKKLIQAVVANAKIPVIETGAGNCHIFVDKTAEFSMAKEIILNAKCSRPSVCNAVETLLVHRDVADAFLPELADAFRAQGVEMRGDVQVCSKLPDAVAATEEDWYAEYNDYIISIKIVDSLDEAIQHINIHNTRHSETIVTREYKNAQRFHDEIDAAAVYVNASTRFTDGGEFGFGAEIGISTQKLHARGPMGLREMTTYKYCIFGDGQIR